LHPYSTDATRPQTVPLALAVAAILLAWGLARLLSLLHTTPAWWFDTPAVLGFYGLLWRLYDRVLWRLSHSGRTLSGVPDLTGEWCGAIMSSFDTTRSTGATLIVRQSSSRILVELRTDASCSYSYLAMVCAAPGPDQGLQYLYANRPSERAVSTMQQHSGTAHLTLSPDGKTLGGGYQNDRFRGTHGSLEFRRRGPL
jgi:hypothetical protein